MNSSAAPSETRKDRKRIRRYFASWSRWLHIYISMFGSATILFFSLTGLTLNHPEWFFQEHTAQFDGTMNTAWLNVDAKPPEGWDEYDYSHQVSRLEIAEHLRSEFNLKGTVTDFLAFEDECEVTFQGPGYAATARIQRDNGEFDLQIQSNDLITVMNDLHKGRHTGTAWSWVIDASAILGILVGVTGFVLIFFLKLRRRNGLIVAAVGTLVTAIFYFLATS